MLLTLSLLHRRAERPQRSEEVLRLRMQGPRSLQRESAHPSLRWELQSHLNKTLMAVSHHRPQLSAVGAVLQIHPALPPATQATAGESLGKWASTDTWAVRAPFPGGSGLSCFHRSTAERKTGAQKAPEAERNLSRQGIAESLCRAHASVFSAPTRVRDLGYLFTNSSPFGVPLLLQNASSLALLTFCKVY